MKKGICVLLTLSLLLLAGCEDNELENYAFPLALGIEADEAEYHIYLAWPDLDDKDASENALSKDAFGDGEADSLSEGMAQMSESGSRNVDMNHVKALILDCGMLDGGERAKELVAFLTENREISWNACVFTAETDMEVLFSDEVQTGVCMGIYLENLVEGWDDIRSGSLVTVGDLVSQYYNGTEQLLIPVISVREDVPTVERFVLTEALTCGEEYTREEVFTDFDRLVIYKGRE